MSGTTNTHLVPSEKTQPAAGTVVLVFTDWPHAGVARGTTQT